MVNPKTRLVDVLIRIPGAAAGSLVLGETMQGVITLRRDSALAVPRSAVLHGAQGDYVFLVQGRKAHRVLITAGLHDRGWVGVDGGLREGDAVVTLGNYELSNGMSVRQVKP